MFSLEGTNNISEGSFDQQSDEGRGKLKRLEPPFLLNMTLIQFETINTGNLAFKDKLTSALFCPVCF